MADADRGCGSLYELYVAARDGNADRVRIHWNAVESIVAADDTDGADRLARAVADEELETVRELVADRLFLESAPPRLDGPLASLVGSVLYGFGYVASFVLFFRAHSRAGVVDRLRWAYRTVGVDIRDTETVDGVERTVFRCPYRNLGAARYGRRHVCHDLLDLVDDGYVTWLDRHRDLEYDRPRACGASECCYSEVTER